MYVCLSSFFLCVFLCTFYFTFILNIVYYVYQMGVQIFVDSEAPSSVCEGHRLQGLARSFLFHKFLPVAMQLNLPYLAVSSFVGNNSAVKVFGINILFFLKSRYSPC